MNISENFYLDGNRCLAFDYLNNGGTNTGGIYVYYQSNSGTRGDILHTTTNEGTEWKTIHYNISTTDGFGVLNSFILFCIFSIATSSDSIIGKHLLYSAF